MEPQEELLHLVVRSVV
jgi:hypothetical protein